MPRRKFWAPQLLLATNLFVFVCMVLTGLGPMRIDPSDLIRWGANYGPELHGIGLLRLITSEFVHVNIVHLLNNLFGLLIASVLVMPVTANAGLLACYLLTGLGASIASTFVHPQIVSAGASGAIFGLYGVWLSLMMLRDPRVKQGLIDLRDVGLYVGINLVIGAAMPHVDFAAHIGGLLTGLMIGLLLFVAGSPNNVPTIERESLDRRVKSGKPKESNKDQLSLTPLVMNKLSSSGGFMKWAYSVGAFALLAAMVVAGFRDDIFEKNPQFGLALIGLGVMFAFYAKSTYGRLADEVFDCGDFLLIRRRGEEDRVALSNIAVVIPQGNAPPLIRLYLVRPGKFGHEIEFTPVPVPFLKPFVRNTIAENLNARVEEAKNRARKSKGVPS